MTNRNLHIALNIFIAAVWLVNGLLCKVLNLVPRHQEIVASILGGEYAALLTKAIGLAEIGMAVWILSGIKSRICTMTQIVIVAAMNVLEFIMVPDTLFWGRFNAVFALAFILIVYYNEFDPNKQVTQKA